MWTAHHLFTLHCTAKKGVRKKQRKKKEPRLMMTVSQPHHAATLTLLKIISERLRGDGTKEYQVQFQDKVQSFWIRKSILDGTFDRMDEVQYRYKGYARVLKDYKEFEQARLRRTAVDRTDDDLQHYIDVKSRQEHDRHRRMRHPNSISIFTPYEWDTDRKTPKRGKEKPIFKGKNVTGRMGHALKNSKKCKKMGYSKRAAHKLYNLPYESDTN